MADLRLEFGSPFAADISGRGGESCDVSNNDQDDMCGTVHQNLLAFQIMRAPTKRGEHNQTWRIQWRSSQSACNDSRLRESRRWVAAEARRPCLRSCHVSLRLMATCCSTLGSR